jgi:hypothetical protein
MQGRQGHNAAASAAAAVMFACSVVAAHAAQQVAASYSLGTCSAANLSVARSNLAATSLPNVGPGSIQSVTVPLLLGESENRLQGSSGSVPFIKSYNATAHSGVDTTAQSSNIVATITPQTQEIRFSDIVIRDLPVDVTAAHIHGPCADATPCSNGPVVYTICSPCPTSSGNTATIPGFTVDLNQLNGNFSTAIGLYQGIMYSNRLYYLNFHTQR